MVNYLKQQESRILIEGLCYPGEIKEEETNHFSKETEIHGPNGLKNKNMKQLNIILAMEKVWQKRVEN